MLGQTVVNMGTTVMLAMIDRCQITVDHSLDSCIAADYSQHLNHTMLLMMWLTHVYVQVCVAYNGEKYINAGDRTELCGSDTDLMSLMSV